jgi:hypothetical protein
VFSGFFGYDKIFGFGQTAGDDDLIDLQAFGTAFGSLSIADNGDGDAVISVANATITLVGTGAAELSASDFLF